MPSSLLIAVGAGLVSGILFASAATGSAFALTLFYLSPLPLLVAGLGWGTAAAAIATAAAALAAAIAIGVAAGPIFVAAIGLPAIVLSYLALLSRPAGEDEEAARDWYPAGRLLAWIALMGGALTAFAVPLIGADAEAYLATVRDLLENRVLKQWEPSAGMDAERIRDLSDILARALPAAFATIWAAIMAFNLWAAGRIVLASGRLPRPWPDLRWIELPPTLTAAFAAAVLLSFLPNLIGVAATGFAGALFLPYVLLGLAIAHVLTDGMPFRFALLTALYLGIFLFGWIALVLGVIGLGEPALRLRERALARRGGTPPPND
jgi:hypothetical protein